MIVRPEWTDGREPEPRRRVPVTRPVHDRAEIDAVTELLERGAAALRLGPRVEEMERRVAEIFGSRFGLMCNSGTSALYLAVELLDLPSGSEVVTPALTFSTDIAPLVRAGLVPVFVDVEADTLNMDAALIEAAVTPATRAILAPNLAGNAPDWDRVREIADAHSLVVIEDSCHALGPVLRGTPTSARADVTVTSFGFGHVITCAGNGGMVLFDESRHRDRGVMLRRWGRRSERFVYGTGEDRGVPLEDLGGVMLDSAFVFDEIAWNVEPSELGAAYGLAQLGKLESIESRRQSVRDRYAAFFARHVDTFVWPRTCDGLETVWLACAVLVRADAGFSRNELQAFLVQSGIDARPIWSGNLARHPFLRHVEHRVPKEGLPQSDRVMEDGLVLPAGYSLDDEDLSYVLETIESFLSQQSQEGTSRR